MFNTCSPHMKWNKVFQNSALKSYNNSFLYSLLYNLWVLSLITFISFFIYSLQKHWCTVRMMYRQFSRILLYICVQTRDCRHVGVCFSHFCQVWTKRHSAVSLSSSSSTSLCRFSPAGHFSIFWIICCWGNVALTLTELIFRLDFCCDSYWRKNCKVSWYNHKW